MTGVAGTLRIHFSDRDFLHVQFAKSPDPIWEAILALHVLTSPEPRVPVRLRPWRRRARHRTGTDLRRTCRLLADLAPPDAPYWPDFLTPVESEDGLAAGLDALRATSAARLAGELRVAAHHRNLPAWTRRLAAGDRGLLGQVADAVRDFHTRLIIPDWSDVHSAVAAERALRLDALDGGLGALLASLPAFTWRDPVLSAPYPHDHVLRLRGRGLRLIPSYFCHTTPVAIVDPRLPPVVVYPLPHRESAPPPAPHLAPLLGANRARVLTALENTTTTGALAARLSMPDSSVSGHLKILREAGLVESSRSGQQVHHRLTGRGRALLGA